MHSYQQCVENLGKVHEFLPHRRLSGSSRFVVKESVASLA